MTDFANVECTAIPDGFYVRQGEPILRLSVVLRPEPTADDGAVPLLDWAIVIPTLSFDIAFGADRASFKSLQAPPRPQFDPPGANASFRRAADRWWKEVWSNDLEREAYVKILDGKPNPPAFIETYGYARLAEMARHRVQSDVEISLIAASYRSNQNSLAADALSAIAQMRLADPDDVTVRVHDAHALHQRHAFADLPIGDALTATLVKGEDEGPGLGAGTASPTLFARLRQIFLESRGVILNRLAGSPSVSATRPRLSPFRPAGRPPVIDDKALFEDRFGDDDIFGPVVTAPAATDANRSVVPKATLESTARFSLAAFDRSVSHDRKRKKEALIKARTPQEEAKAAAGHTVAALQAHPSLRQFVCLIVDIPLPLAQVPEALRTAGKGVVSVNVQGRGAASRKIATAFVLRTAGDAASHIFEPCPEADFTGRQASSLVPSLPLANGVVRLNQPVEDDPDSRRFRIESVDGVRALLSLRRALQGTIFAARSGVANDRALADEATLRTRGLSLLDTQANVPAEIAEHRRQNPPAPVNGYELVHAEDLVEGYRVDILNTDNVVFRAGARSLTYSNMPARYAEADMRDEGFIINGPRTWTEKSTTSGKPDENVAMVSEHLLSWSGGNIGLPSTPVDGEPLPRDVLPGKITYAFLQGDRGPILREHGLYRYMLRARKLNGSSISIASSRLLAKEHALGDPHDTKNAYRFAPFERTTTPVVLVPDGQKLIDVAPAAASDKQDNVPSPETIILKALDDPVIRILVSPPIGFDGAEQQGQFDFEPLLPGETMAKAEARANRRATRGCYQNLLHDSDGNFPHWDDAAEKKGRALRFQLVAPSATAPEHPHYVDQTLCHLGVRLKATKATPALDDAQTSPPDEISFWQRTAADRQRPDQGFDPDRVLPIMLQVIRSQSDTSAALNVANQPISSNGRRINLPTLRIEIAPGETLELEIWLPRTGQAAQYHPLVRSLLQRTDRAWLIDAKSADHGAREAWWHTLTAKTRIAPFHDVLRFAIEYPLAKPAKVPEFDLFGCARVTTLKEWASVADEPRKIFQRDAELTMSYGSLTVDRKTTGSVWSEAIWLEHDPQLVRSRTSIAEKPGDVEQNGLWQFSPRLQRARLFTIADLPALTRNPGESRSDFIRRANRVDLVKDEAGGLRALSADFKSHIARQVLVRFVARSRFAPLDAPDSEAHEESSVNRVAFEAALTNGTTPTGVAKFWLLATRPPPPPKLMKHEGVLYRRRYDALPAASPTGPRGARLSHIYRCWLDSDWFAGGEGEKLAVVCLDPQATSQPKWVISRLSRWGGDMTMAPSQELRPAGISREPTFLDASQIIDGSGVEGKHAEIRDSFMAIPHDVTVNPADVDSYAVKLAVLDPIFDSGSGRWYCDIELAAAPAFRLSAKLSLARYQEHAIEGCHLSETVVADAFLLHQPWEFRAVRRGNRIDVIAAGPSYIGRAPMTQELTDVPDTLDVPARAAAPLISVELERLDDDGTGPLPVLNADGELVTTNSLVKGVTVDRGYGDNPAAGLPAGWTRWTMTLEVPTIETAKRLAVRISLASAHANSRADGQPSVDGSLIYLPEPQTIQIDL